MKVLVTGGTGMLGHKLVQRLSHKFEVYSTIRGPFEEVARFGIFDPYKVIENVDLGDQVQIRTAVESVMPDVVVNAAGIIKQLPTSNDVVATLSINSILPHQLASLGHEYEFRLITISTDCVFSGIKGSYSEEDVPDALDLYGTSKRLGELTYKNSLTIRTSIIGRELQSGHSLVEWLLSNRGENVKGFRRAIYSGFPTIVFADIISNLLSQFPTLSGTYHVSSDPIDKFTMLKLINNAYCAQAEIDPDDTFVIDRSLNSSKFRTETGFEPLSWKEMVDQMAADPTPYGKFAK
jgi:dTDP-4-dehydrorhamnose reductase